VPDFYQGTELWDLSLVDPDNRRPVDYETRRRLLVETMAAAERGDGLIEDLLEHRHDARVKLFVTARALAVRAHLGHLFERGDYVPLHAAGARRDCIFAFARRDGDAMSLTCVPRLVASLTPDAARPPLGAGVWTDTRVELPPAAAQRYRDAFTGAILDVVPDNGGAVLPAAAIFDRFPVALLVPFSH
jgi:(1->4)-alpha-D-glucan 1-alpha-D-glucosylmutase